MVDVLPDGDHVRARRHHFADGLVAERDDGVDELAVVFLDQALIGAGLDQGVEILLLAVPFSSPPFSWLAQRGQGLEKSRRSPSAAGRASASSFNRGTSGASHRALVLR